MKRVILLCHCILSISICAQTFIQEPIEFVNFEYSVRQMSEFMRRFNLQDIIVKPEEDSLWRYTNRMLLFDKSTYFANQEIADELINKIERENIELHFQDTSWSAIVKCEVLYQGKKDTLLLILKTEQIKDDVYKWSIADVRGPIINIQPKTHNERIRISPVENEMGFMSLPSVTTSNAKNIVLYSKKNYKSDNLTVFNAFVYAGILKIVNTTSLIYHFKQVNGFEFYVSRFNRETRNSGWLISKINRILNSSLRPDEQKDSTNEDVTIIKTFYEMLSTYAANPDNPSLSRQIASLFIEPNKYNAFLGVSSLYNDIDVYFNNYPETLVGIGTYLAAIENYKNRELILNFSPTDIKQIRENQNTKEIIYNLEIQSLTNKQLTYIFPLMAIIKDNKIITIVPIRQQ